MDKTVNLLRSALAFAAVTAAAALAAPGLINARQWVNVSATVVTIMLVFTAYGIYYLAVGIAYIVRKRAHDRHIFPEGIRLEGANAVRLGLRYLVLSSIALFGATLLYAVILRGLRHGLQ